MPTMLWVLCCHTSLSHVRQTNIYQKHDAEMIRVAKRGDVEEELRVQVCTVW